MYTETIINLLENHKTLIFTIQENNSIKISTPIDAYYNTRDILVIEDNENLHTIRFELKSLGYDTLLKENGGKLVVNNLDFPNRVRVQYNNEKIIVNWSWINHFTSFDPNTFLKKFSDAHPEFFRNIPREYDSMIAVYKSRYPSTSFPTIPDRTIEFRILKTRNNTLTGTVYLCISDDDGQIYSGDESLGFSSGFSIEYKI